MTLLEEIRAISPEAARELERAECCTDSDIRTLTQPDLQELLPGFSNFRIRKKIYETIHKRRPIHVVLNELRRFVPDECLKNALDSNGAVHEYLQVLKELKVEMNHVQQFLDAHIDLLEKYGQNQHSKTDEGQSLVPSCYQAPGASSVRPATNNDCMEQMVNSYHQKAPKTSHKENHLYSQKPQASSSLFNRFKSGIYSRPHKQATVTYKMVVSGKTLDSHLDVMGKIKSDVRGCFNLEESQSDEDSQVIIVFCPVVSRVRTDVENALKDVSENKPVITVMMHHSRNAQPHPIVKPLYHNVILVVNVFFHDSVHGLLKCPQNDEAIASIQNILQLFADKT